ncbi:MAG: phage head-tail connector protein [Bacteroidota bacterium]|nr:phage head-tail connector protein [Bacteroidota bacterium]
MYLKQTIKPVSEQVPLETLKEHLRLPLSYTAEDGMLNIYLNAAAKVAEDRTNRQLLESTWTFKCDRFPEKFVINKTPLIAVDSIKYTDGTGLEQTLNASQYIVNAQAEPFEITPAYGLSWPTTRLQANAVAVTFRAGYISAEEIPSNIIAGMLLIVDDLFKNRGSIVIGRLVSNIPMTAESLFSTERVAVL